MPANGLIVRIRKSLTIAAADQTKHDIDGHCGRSVTHSPKKQSRLCPYQGPPPLLARLQYARSSCIAGLRWIDIRTACYVEVM